MSWKWKKKRDNALAKTRLASEEGYLGQYGAHGVVEVKG